MRRCGASGPNGQGSSSRARRRRHGVGRWHGPAGGRRARSGRRLVLRRRHAPVDRLPRPPVRRFRGAAWAAAGGGHGHARVRARLRLPARAAARPGHRRRHPARRVLEDQPAGAGHQPAQSRARSSSTTRWRWRGHAAGSWRSRRRIRCRASPSTCSTSARGRLRASPASSVASPATCRTPPSTCPGCWCAASPRRRTAARSPSWPTPRPITARRSRSDGPAGS